MDPTNNPVHLAIAPTFHAANEDRDAVTFGTRQEVIRWRHRNREERGRVRVRPGYTMKGIEHGDLTPAWVRAYWVGTEVDGTAL